MTDENHLHDVHQEVQVVDRHGEAERPAFGQGHHQVFDHDPLVQGSPCEEQVQPGRQIPQEQSDP